MKTVILRFSLSEAQVLCCNFIPLQGRFEILCLSGSYLLTDNSGSRGRSGGLSISLASPDGRVIGGGVGGMLIAASPVQVRFYWLCTFHILHVLHLLFLSVKCCESSVACVYVGPDLHILDR